MPPRRRRDGRYQGLLPLRRRPLTHTFSCWYCDIKTSILNERLYSMGRQHSKFLQVWFTMGIGFSCFSMIVVVLILIWESTWLVPSHEEKVSLMEKSRDSFYAATPMVLGFNIPLIDVGYISLGMVFSVGVHEFGHALAAASEGVHVEYIAVFLLVLVFPGAWVAINSDTLQLLSHIRVLRIYCAGIWHNAVCCTVCWLTLASLPVLLCSMYTHGKNPVVLNIPPSSSLAGHLLPGDSILAVDGIHVYNSREWMQKLNLMHLQALQKQNLLGDSYVTNEGDAKEHINTDHVERGFCVPIHWLLENQKIHAINHTISCFDENIRFVKIPCLNHSYFGTEGSMNFTENFGQKSFCLRAKDVVKLAKCGTGWSQSKMTGVCPCLENELCLKPGLSSGLMLIEVTYSRPNAPECLQRTAGLGRNISIGSEIKEHEVIDTCQFSLLFVGDALSLAYSLQLTDYQPCRLGFFNISMPIWLPNIFEKLLTYTFHVSASLVLLNSAPVFYLDGESILETTISIFTSFPPRKKRRMLCFFLTSGSMLLLLSILAGFKLLFF